MKKLFKSVWVYYLLVILTISCSYAQKKEELSPKPRVHIDVKKETDEHGNVIRYDSSYTWSWSNFDSNYDFNKDSIFSNFFKDWQIRFNMDSLFLSPFSFSPFEDDWYNFDKQMEKMLQHHRDMMKRHDEIMKNFFQPDIIIPAPEEQNSESQNNKKQTKSKPNNNSGIDL